MSNISQHQAAEVWEIARDHHVTAAKINWMCREIQDTQLRSQLEQAARRYQQIGQQLTSTLQQSGFQGNGGFQQSGQFQSGFQSSYQGGQSGQTSQNQGFSSQSYQSGTSAIDILAVGECLKDCKGMAVKSMIAATESSQPLRNTLYQIAGEHLQMAEQHYHWLDQKQLYASPKADQQSTQEYQRALQQIAQAGQSAGQKQQFQTTANYAQSSAYSYNAQQPHQYQQQHQQQQHQPSYSGAQYTSSTSQQIRQ